MESSPSLCSPWVDNEPDTVARSKGRCMDPVETIPSAAEGTGGGTGTVVGKALAGRVLSPCNARAVNLNHQVHVHTACLQSHKVPKLSSWLKTSMIHDLPHAQNMSKAYWHLYVGTKFVVFVTLIARIITTATTISSSSTIATITPSTWNQGTWKPWMGPPAPHELLVCYNQPSGLGDTSCCHPWNPPSGKRSDQIHCRPAAQYLEANSGTIEHDQIPITSITKFSRQWLRARKFGECYWKIRCKTWKMPKIWFIGIPSSWLVRIPM